MLYAALGDSITYGYASSTEETRFAGRVVSSLSKQDKVNLYVHAKPGWTSRRLLKTLQDVPKCIWDEAQLITIMVGGNDLLKALPWLIDGKLRHLGQVTRNLHRNLTEIVRLVKRPQSKIVLATIYNPFPNSAVAEECVEALNKAIRLVVRQEDLILADVRQQFFSREHHFVGGYRRGLVRDFRIFGNPIHPNDEGHLEIARTVLRSYRRSVVQNRMKSRKSSQGRQNT
ncbi:SGNH/GDSL hydrolase family protein [Alicyclobacillus sp. SO9]|uniref:SGNH/GDSL hydrolase family protein n=1 Tax=Alicyclobacillus sp. SO9 TaxID=2665646 RepID=UPI0018E813C3|nr:SGNH/GDSL hydrolase family protein [Alicyclobacillus sp. SO9]QQE78492.1 SGNH/GDSL hydrolase family protein [Alicyclobacillus sp. SO9]